MRNITFVGLDVHKATVAVSIAAGGHDGEVRHLGSLENRPEVVRRAHARGTSDIGPEVLAENRFLAARDGMLAQLIDHRTSAGRPAWDALMHLLDDCRPAAAELDCASELERAAALARDPGATRQRRHADAPA